MVPYECEPLNPKMLSGEAIAVIDLVGNAQDESDTTNAIHVGDVDGVAVVSLLTPSAERSDESEGDKTVEKEDPIVQLAASKIALLIGLHEYGDLAETVMEYVYQNREGLLVNDAKALNLRIVSKDEELGELMAKAGTKVAPQLNEILTWTRDRRKPVTQQAATELLKSVDGLVAEAHGKRKLAKEEAQEVKRQLSERIRLSYGCRNEDLALKTYEKKTGCSVRLSNQEFYSLRFPRLEPSPSPSAEAIDYYKVEQLIESSVAAKGRRRRAQESQLDAQEGQHGQEDPYDNQSVAQAQSNGRSADPYFTICGMIDGLADTLAISEDDEWRLVPILLEVKNRMRAFRVPPPLHDYIQMAIYLKMVGVTEGDLVQCLHADRAQIHITRVSLSEYPLRCTTISTPSRRAAPDGSGLWVSVLLPRLYAVVGTVEKLRSNDLLRLAFLNGSETERMEILRKEWSFL